jgi:hypothetical protein
MTEFDAKILSIANRAHTECLCLERYNCLADAGWLYHDSKPRRLVKLKVLKRKELP